jgi:D-glycero-alpha-D-manno-heptose-7-phosphate kinase
MLFYTGQGRKASDVLAVQNGQIAENAPALRQMADQALQGCRLLYQGDLDGFGELLHRAWELKRGLCDKISNPEIDAMYARARAAGALGGKITGAGGGGFLLVYAPPERQDAVREAFAAWREMPFALEPAGARVILDYRRD